MIIFVLFATAQLSCAALLRNDIMQPQIIALDDVEGLFYDVSEYDDPLLHQLSSIGASPLFTFLESAKRRGNSKGDDIPDKVRVAESKKIVDAALSRLELARAKLEKGNVNINADIEKVIQSLKTLRTSSRPDITQGLNTLQSIIALSRPMKMSEIKELLPTSEPESSEKIEVLEKPQSFGRQSLRVRVISDTAPKLDEKPELKNTNDSAYQSTNTEISSLEEKLTEERIKPSEASEIPKQDHESTKPPFEFKMKENKKANFDGEDVLSSYKAKLTWKAAGVA